MVQMDGQERVGIDGVERWVEEGGPETNQHSRRLNGRLGAWQAVDGVKGVMEER